MYAYNLNSDEILVAQRDKKPNYKSYTMFGDLANIAQSEAFFLPKYLDVPVVTTEVDLCVLYLENKNLRPMLDPKRIPTRVRAVCDDLMRQKEFISSGYKRVEPSMYPDLWEIFSVPDNEVKDYHTFIRDTADPVIRAIRHYMLKELDVCLSESSVGLCDPTAQQWLKHLLWWCKFIDMYDVYRSSGGRSHRWCRHGGSNVLMSTGACVLITREYAFKPLILSYDALIGLKDAMYYRFNATWASSQLYRVQPTLLVLIQKLWKWQEKCLRLYGNEGYELAKSTESLSKTYCGWYIDTRLRGPGNSFDNMCVKHATKEMKICTLLGLPEPKRWLWEDFLDECLAPTENITQIVELFGLQKGCMHPDIDVTKGGRSAANEARSPDITMPGDAIETRATFCRQFCEGYIQKHGRWPPLRNTQPGTRLHSYYTRGVLLASRHDISPSDWSLVSFGKVFDFDYHLNFLEVIDDKSINVKYSERCSAWDKKVLTTSERRMVIEVLKREAIDHEEFVNYIDQWIINPDWCTVALTPKEREFKIAARMFAMMVLEMRNAATIIESNLADKVLKYLPQLTMADDKLTVHQRLLRLTTPLDELLYLRIFIELDLSRWNLRWRELMVSMIGKDLNALFGMSRVYTWIHRYFSQCMIYVRSANMPPTGIEQHPPPESDLLWMGQYGGLEGLAQKLWSICTIAMIARGIDDLDGSYTMTAQGDNVMLTCVVPRDSTLDYEVQYQQVRDWLTQRSSTYAAQLNQELKPEECVDSSCMVTYSKAVYINGVDYPLTLKGVARMFPTTATDFPTIEAYIATMFSTGLATAESARSPIELYFYTLQQAAFATKFLRKSSGPYQYTMQRVSLGTDTSLTRLALLMPACLGGYSVSGFYEFLYRGGGDPVSKSLASCYSLRRYLPDANMIIERVLSDSTYVERPSVRDLIKDPYSLPVRHLTSPSDAIAETTLEVVRSAVRNKDIKTVLARSSKQYECELIDALSTMSPFNPVIAHDLYDTSILGTETAIKKMFLTTRSVQTLARSTGAGDITSTLLDVARGNILARDYIFKGLYIGSDYVGSLYNLITCARSRWSKSGVTPEGITSYLPVDFPVSFSSNLWPECIKAFYVPPTSDPKFTRGPHKAYMGVRTREKRAEHGYKIVGHGQATSALRTMQRLYSWSTRSESMAKLIDHLSLSRSTYRLSEVADSLTTIIGGSTSHRYANRVSAASAHIMGQSTFSSHIEHDSNEAGFLSASKDDYPLMFQEFYLYMTAICDMRVNQQNQHLPFIMQLRLGDRPLDPLLGDRFNINATSLPSLDYRSLPLLVRDPAIKIVQDTYAPITSLIPFEPISPQAGRLYAIDCLLRRAIYSGPGPAGIFDNLHTQFRIPLGVLELSRIGIGRFIDSVSRVILGIMTTSELFSRSMTGRHISLSYMLLKLGYTMLEPLAVAVTHKEFNNDPLKRQLALAEGLAYENKRYIRSRLYAHLMDTVSKQLSSSTSSFHLIPHVIYADSQSDEQSYVAQSRLRQILSRLSVANETITAQCIRAMRQCTRVLEDSLRLPKEEAVLTLPLMYASTKDSKYGEYKAPQAIRDVMRRLLLGVKPCVIYWCDLSAEECIRLWREETVIQLAVDFIPKPVEHEILYHQVLYTSVEDYHIADSAAYDVHTIRFLKHLGYPMPRWCRALLVWWAVNERITGNQVLILGCGIGGAALVCAYRGVKIIVGHDLRWDIINARSLLHTVPPMLGMFAPSAYYRQTQQSYLTDGDLRNTLILDAVLADNRSSEIILIDLPISLEEIQRILTLVSKRGRAKKILVRLRYQRDSATLLYSWIARHFMVTYHVEIMYTDLVQEALLEITSVRDIALSLPARVIPSVNSIVLTIRNKYWVESCTALGISHTKTLMIAASEILVPLAAVTHGTIRGACRVAYKVFLTMLERDRDHPLYEEWTEILHAACRAHVLSRWSLQELVKAITEESYIDLPRRGGGPNIRLPLTPQLKADFSSRVAGVWVHRDTPLTS